GPVPIRGITAWLGPGPRSAAAPASVARKGNGRLAASSNAGPRTSAPAEPAATWLTNPCNWSWSKVGIVRLPVPTALEIETEVHLAGAAVEGQRIHVDGAIEIVSQAHPLAIVAAHDDRCGVAIGVR